MARISVTSVVGVDVLLGIWKTPYAVSVLMERITHTATSGGRRPPVAADRSKPTKAN
jgi:hypothetical protein